MTTTQVEKRTPRLSIGITSYDRPAELLRCLKSISTDCIDDIEIIVSEDVSPSREEIVTVVDEFSRQVPYNVRLNLNEKNLGYDGNLGRLISLSKGKYIVLMSDDDIFSEGAIDIILDETEKHDFGVGYSPFYSSSDRGALTRCHTNWNTRIIEPNSKMAIKCVYDAILFSGLIFNRSYVSRYSAEQFKNVNYYQVFLFLCAMTDLGGLYIEDPLVVCVSDGKNGYGLSESSGGNELLSDRQSVFSYPEFHKGLVRAIAEYDELFNVNTLDAFSKEYSLRLYTKLSDARRMGRNELDSYWVSLKSLGIKLTPVAYLYYFGLSWFGSAVCDSVLSVPKSLAKRMRGSVNV